MIKLFRRFRLKMIKENRTSRYLLYAFGEILLVMIGILLALQVNNWNTQRNVKIEERTSYGNIKRQINDDKSVIQGNIDYNNLYMEQFEFASQIIDANDRSRMDTLGFTAFNLVKYSDFNRNGNIYETLVNSGEIKLLNSNEIKDGIQRLEETYIYMNRMEKIHFDAIMLGVVSELHTILKFSDRSVQKPERLYSYEFQNQILTFIGIMEEKDEIYLRAIKEINSITTLIDNELNSDI